LLTLAVGETVKDVNMRTKYFFKPKSAIIDCM